MIFHVNLLLGRGLTGNIMSYFLRKIKVKKNIVLSAVNLLSIELTLIISNTCI